MCVSPRSTSQGYCGLLLDAPFANTNRATAAAGYESGPARGLRLAPARAIGVLFLLQRSCLASAVHWAARNRRLALGRCAPMVPRGEPPFPASCAFAAAAIPGSRWPPFPGVARAVAAIPRTASTPTINAARSAQPSTASDSRIEEVNHLNRRRRRSRCLCQRTRAQRLSARRGEPRVCLGQALRSTARRASPRRR